MKHIFFCLLAIFFTGYSSMAFHQSFFSQTDTTRPLTVTISIEREYVETMPKNQFAYEIKWEHLNIKSDSVKQKKYDIAISLTNTSSEKIGIWMMSCSWFENFMINNNYIFKTLPECIKNIPRIENFTPGEVKIFHTTLTQSIKFEYPCEGCVFWPQVAETKIGWIIIDDYYKPRLTLTGYNLSMEDKSTYKIIWSNPLYLLSEKQLNRDLKFPPIYQQKDPDL